MKSNSVSASKGTSSDLLKFATSNNHSYKTTNKSIMSSRADWTAAEDKFRLSMAANMIWSLATPEFKELQTAETLLLLSLAQDVSKQIARERGETVPLQPAEESASSAVDEDCPVETHQEIYVWLKSIKKIKLPANSHRFFQEFLSVGQAVRRKKLLVRLPLPTDPR